MTLYTYFHHDGRKSVRESHKQLIFVVVVKTPKETRREIEWVVQMFNYLIMDNIDRALADGTVDERPDGRYIGGLWADSIKTLQQAWTNHRILSESSLAREEQHEDLYQVVGWFEDLADAEELSAHLQNKYNDEPWKRDVYVDFVSEES